MNKNIKVIISGVILASSILGSVPVFADNHSNVESNTVIESNKGFKFTEEEKSYLANWLIENGVNENTKDKLMEKLEKGEMWDSISGGNPVKIEKLDEMTEKTIYEDGSIIVSGSELENNKNNRALSGGTTQSGSGYISRLNVKVYQNSGVINAHFYANYTNANGGYDIIDSIRDPKVVTVGGTVSDIKLKMVKRREDAGGHAQARLSFTVSSYGGVVGGNCWLDLRVGGDNAYTKYSY